MITFQLVSKASTTHSWSSPFRSVSESVMGLVIFLPMGSTGPSWWSRLITLSAGRPKCLMNAGEASIRRTIAWAPSPSTNVMGSLVQAAYENLTGAQCSCDHRVPNAWRCAEQDWRIRREETRSMNSNKRFSRTDLAICVWLPVSLGVLLVVELMAHRSLPPH